MSEELEKQNVIQLAYRYTRSLSRWIKAGRPARPQSEINVIFEQCCRPCENFDLETSSCQLCGCRVNTKKSAPLNKIAMATEKCPINKW